MGRKGRIREALISGRGAIVGSAGRDCMAGAFRGIPLRMDATANGRNVRFERGAERIYDPSRRSLSSGRSHEKKSVANARKNCLLAVADHGGGPGHLLSQGNGTSRRKPDSRGNRAVDDSVR